MPSIVIRFEIEAQPTVHIVAATEGEEERLRDWVLSHPEFRDLLCRAVELSEAGDDVEDDLGLAA